MEHMSMLEKERFENVLKSLRVKRGKDWTQEETARHLGISRRTYVGWENGESFPSKKALKRLAALFQLDETEAEALFHSTHQAAPVRHNLPFARNPRLWVMSPPCSRSKRFRQKKDSSSCYDAVEFCNQEAGCRVWEQISV